VICGYTKGQGRRSGSFGALVLGVHVARSCEWVGNVGTGFDEREIDELLEKLEPLRA
jgi:bifunctional non-homologous end joining protein LigD